MASVQFLRCVGLSAAVIGWLVGGRLFSQQFDQPKSGTAQGRSDTEAANLSETALKEKILTSQAWKQAYDEFQKWLASQPIFSPADVARLNANLLAQIQLMPASELQNFLDDWHARLRVLKGRDFKDAQQWLGEYLSAMADGFRRQTLIRLGITDFANMTASQLEDAFIRVRAHRLSIEQRQAAFDQRRLQMVQSVQQYNAAVQPRPRRTSSSAAQFTTNQSPYRPPNFNPPPPPRRQFFVDGNGQIGFTLPN